MREVQIRSMRVIVGCSDRTRETKKKQRMPSEQRGRDDKNSNLVFEKSLIGTSLSTVDGAGRSVARA